MEPARLDPGLARVLEATPLPGRQARRRRRRAELRTIVVRRTVLAVPVVLGVSLLVFLLAAVSPFDPLAAYLGDRYVQASVEQRRQLSEALNLETSWFSAWWQWAGSALTGDFGHSRVFRQPVTAVMAERLPWTLLVAGTGLFLAVVTALLAAVRCAYRPGGPLDRAVGAAATVLQGLPRSSFRWACWESSPSPPAGCPAAD